MLMVENERERQILSLAFNQLDVKILHSTPSYATYVKALQFLPDIVIMELPRMNSEQVHFSQIIRKNKKTKKIPIIGYGNKCEEGIKRSLEVSGVSNLLERPLKFSLLIKKMQQYLKLSNKTIGGVNQKEIQSEKEDDIKQILDSTTLPTKKIELMVKHISGLMAFPFTVAKTLQLTESNKSGANDLAKVIEADPVISTSILKVSNTVFFASLNRRINTIKDAIVRIGFGETKKIVMAIKVVELFDKDQDSLGFNRMNFWLHSLAVAILSERIAKRMGTVSSDEAFLAGLLHDFGVILLDEFYPTIFSTILEAATDNSSRFITTEDRILKITHNDVTKELFNSWKIPETITNAIYMQPSVLHSDKAPVAPEGKLALCTALGNIIAKSYHFGAGCDQCIRPIEKWTFDACKMSTGLGKDFHENISRDLDMYRKFLNLEEDKPSVGKEKKEIGVFYSSQCLFSPAEAYLGTIGHSVTRIPPSDSYTDFDKKFDAVIVWADKDHTLEKINPLINIIKHTKEKLDETQPPIMAPVLGIIPEDSALKNAEGTKNLSLMYNEFDLRLLDLNLDKVFEKEPITPLGETEISLSPVSETVAKPVVVEDVKLSGDSVEDGSTQIEDSEDVATQV